MTSDNSGAKPVLGILLGDAAGVGPEIVAKIAADGFLEEQCRPVVIGDKRTLELGMRQAGVSFPYNVVDSVGAADFAKGVQVLDQKNLDPASYEVGKANPATGKAVGDDFLTAIDLFKEGLIDGILYASINKTSLRMGGYKYESELKMFVELFGITTPACELNVLDGVMTSRVTSHIPIRNICDALTIDEILGSIVLLHDTLVKSGVARPRLGVAALNPHCGEEGTCGREEIDVIRPAVEAARERGIDATGPYSADTLFVRAFKKEFDGVVTMYHDQGQIALKAKGFDYGVVVQGGIPVPITTPAHGSAYDIAGKNLANTDSIRNSLRLLAAMATKR